MPKAPSPGGSPDRRDVHPSFTRHPRILGATGMVHPLRFLGNNFECPSGARLTSRPLRQGLRGRWRRINVQKIGRGGRELPSRGASRRSHREPIATPVSGSPTLYPAVIFGPGLHVIDMNEALGVVTEVDDPRW